MFKKIEIWILYLVVLLGIPTMIGYGMLVRHEMLGGKKLGRIPEFSLFLAELPTNFRRFLNRQKYQNIQPHLIRSQTSRKNNERRPLQPCNSIKTSLTSRKNSKIVPKAYIISRLLKPFGAFFKNSHGRKRPFKRI